MPQDPRQSDAPSTATQGAAESPKELPSGVDATASQTHRWRVDVIDRPRPDAPVSLLEDVRVGRHDAYDRVTFELTAAVPGYHIEYVEKPVRQCGSGDPVAVAGDGWLEVRLQPAAAHTEAGAPTVEDRNRRLDLPLVRQLVLTCDFEADVTWVLGVASPNRYRILELSDPPRLVIDIAHDP